MTFALLFLSFAAVLLAEAALLGGWYTLLAWPGLSFLGVGRAYAGLGPRLLGKRADGSLAAWAVALLLPYFLLTWLLWHVQRRLSAPPPCQEVAPGLWLGRRLLPAEVPAGISLVVDLTAEFPEPGGVRRGRTYRCLPTLDGHVPSVAALAAVVEALAGWPGPAVVHCAAGHGRSAMVAACVLLRRGLASSPAQAEEILRGVRPNVELSRRQRETVAAYARANLPPA